MDKLSLEKSWVWIDKLRTELAEFKQQHLLDAQRIRKLEAENAKLCAQRQQEQAGKLE